MNQTIKSKTDILDYKKEMNTEFKPFLSGGNKPQQRCFDRAGDDKFFVVHQRPIGNDNFTNTYSSFININKFLDYYSPQDDEEKRYYELIKNECPEYFDFDFEMSDWEGKNKHEKINNCIKEFLTVRNEFSYHNDINNMTYKKDDLIILESCGINSKGQDRLSLHIIVRPEMNGRSEKFFTCCKDQKIFQQQFEEFLKTQDTKIVIDMSVYSSNSLMRLFDSHKKNEVDRKFKPFGMTIKNIKDRRLLFCSYVSDTSCPLTVSKPEKNTEVKDFELELSNNEVKTIFNHLNSKRWEEYESWRTLIWLGLKLGLSEGDIHEYSQDAQNYCEEATTKMIDEYSPEKCNISMGTLFYYLQKDVDSKTYKELVNPYILDRLTQNKIDDLIHTKGYIEKKDRWVLPEVLEGSKCTVIKAGLGKGKTTASIAHINSKEYDRIIVLTPRRTFAKSVCNRLNDKCKGIEFVMYSNLKGKDYMIRNPYIVIQVESLNRLELNENDRTLLLCDEVESVLFQMTVSKTHKEKHIQNLDMLERLFRESTKIICLDAFISNRTLTTLRLMNVPYTYYNYTLPLEDRTCFRIQSSDGHSKEKDNFTTKLLLDLGQNKKIFLFSSSNNTLTSDFIPTIRKKYPNKKVIEYHSKFTSLDLTKVNDNWKDADVIACTSTITVGCNFDLEDVFDKVYVYANASSKNLVRDIFQATYRIRHIRDKEMIYCIDKRHFGVNLSTHKKEIEQDLKMKYQYIVNQYEQHLQMNYPNKRTPEWIKQLVLSNIYEQNMSIMMLEEMFKRYLTECSYEHEDIDDEELEEEMDMDEEECIVDDLFEYKDIHELTFSQMKELRKKKIESSLTRMEETQLEKYYFQHMLVEKNCIKQEMELWSVYIDYGKGKFRNLSYEKGYKDGSVRICDIVSDVYPEISSRLALRVELIDEMCTTLGLRHSQDFTEVSKEKIEGCVEWFKNNSKRIHSVFEIRNNKKTDKFTARNTTELINKVFSKWGYSKVKKGKQIKKGIRGKQVDVTPYNVENVFDQTDSDDKLVIDVYEHVKAKKIKQTDRKVKRMKEGEHPFEEEE